MVFFWTVLLPRERWEFASSKCLEGVRPEAGKCLASVQAMLESQFKKLVEQLVEVYEGFQWLKKLTCHVHGECCTVIREVCSRSNPELPLYLCCAQRGWMRLCAGEDVEISASSMYSPFAILTVCFKEDRDSHYCNNRAKSWRGKKERFYVKEESNNDMKPIPPNKACNELMELIT